MFLVSFIYVWVFSLGFLINWILVGVLVFFMINSRFLEKDFVLGYLINRLVSKFYYLVKEILGLIG